MKKFNLNSYVYFEPTEIGLKMYSDHYAKYSEMELRLIDGVAKLQFHEFVRVYGYAITTAFLGSKMPFKHYEIFINNGDLDG